MEGGDEATVLGFVERFGGMFLAAFIYRPWLPQLEDFAEILRGYVLGLAVLGLAVLGLASSAVERSIDERHGVHSLDPCLGKVH